MNRKRRRGKIITVFATFLAFMGIGVVDPLLPVIAEQIGASSAQVELLFTAYIFTMAIMMLPSGLAAGKIGDKKMMVIGLGIVTVFSLVCGFSNSIAELSIFRAGWGLGNSMFFATAMTLLIALSDDVSSAVGLYEAAIGLGMAGGPLVGGLLGGVSWRYPFFATGILIFLAFILVLSFVKEPANMQRRQAAGLREMGRLFTNKPFIQGALAGMLYYYGFFTVLSYSPIVLRLSAIQLGFIFFGWGLCLAYGSAVLSHQLERRWQPRSLIRFGLFVFAIFLALMLFVKTVWILVVLIIASGLISGLNNALFTSYVMECSPYARGITSGVYNFVRWLGAAIAPILSGYIGDTYAPHTPFGVTAIVVIIGFLLMLIPVKTANKERSERSDDESSRLDEEFRSALRNFHQPPVPKVEKVDEPMGDLDYRKALQQFHQSEKAVSQESRQPEEKNEDFTGDAGFRKALRKLKESGQ
ncbi:MFS transporter [Aneurinibacillus sp. Ricciae_BoGa-3]|uniref:MFS transporter n=1 Tax=Aneurinibacillus sp. Ricciae_BoGa-3 TaxID=3022697 RepID=UPI0023405198|nr:MFS transporter [Aneurinibacillus sp. Ricciae_BoGa-3]WCK56882.1 MFS transporter [Aneurinibacillus sp. Ricciae_BoGa-3]